MGAYIIEKLGDERNVSYIQSVEPSEGEKYSYFVSSELFNK